ncbi:YciI family protein [Amycolatopsis sp. WGS_07]|uniref:YciI family protein n=1 Tax=Amycolatopsis sp. WGS_07 TaxID=3076764 RepID=UPI003873CB48
MQYAMLICGDDREWAALSAADEEAAMTGIYAWFERWQPTGKVGNGVELQPRETAKTVRAGSNGQPVVTDGPYVELKEVVGSVIVLECADLDEAVEIAASWPLGPGVSAVEVRPMLSREEG